MKTSTIADMCDFCGLISLYECKGHIEGCEYRTEVVYQTLGLEQQRNGAAQAAYVLTVGISFRVLLVLWSAHRKCESREYPGQARLFLAHHSAIHTTRQQSLLSISARARSVLACSDFRVAAHLLQLQWRTEWP